MPLKVDRSKTQHLDISQSAPLLPKSKSKPLLTPDVPSNPAARPTKKKTKVPGITFGSTTLAATTAAVALAFSNTTVHGQSVADIAVDPVDPVDPVTLTVHQEYQTALARLEQQRDAGRFTPREFTRAKTALKNALLDKDGSVLQRDERGRIDLDVAAELGALKPGSTPRTKGQLAFDRLGKRLEQRMRITARDLASGNFTPLQGAPGYKQIEAEKFLDLVGDTLQDIPLGELNGGKQLARFVQKLPKADHLNAQQMTLRELTDTLGDAYEDILKAKFDKLIDGREVEVGIVAFAAVTGLRAASPEAAELMDALDPRLSLYHAKSDNGHHDAQAHLTYRDAHVLPDLDLEARTRLTLGQTTFRAGLDGTLSAEADDPFVATATLGAHREIGNWWVDASGAYHSGLDQWNAQLNAGTYDPKTDWHFSTGVSATFGDGVAHGDADGRLKLHTDLTREFEWRGAVGDFGLYTGAGVDTDGGHNEVTGGLIFRLRF